MSAPAGVEVLKRPRASFAGSSETAYLCDTAPAMEMVGMRRLPVMMWVSHLSTMMDPSRGDIHLHGLDAQAISGLPGLLEEPAVIMDTSWTATRTDVVVMLLDAVDSHGNPLVAAIRPDANIPTRRYGPCIPSNTLLSAYGRLDIDDYLRFMRRNRKILFIDGNRLESLARKCPRNISAPLAGLKRDRMLQPSSVVRATDAIGSGDGIVEWQDGRDLHRRRPREGQELLRPGNRPLPALPHGRAQRGLHGRRPVGPTRIRRGRPCPTGHAGCECRRRHRRSGGLRPGRDHRGDIGPQMPNRVLLRGKGVLP